MLPIMTACSILGCPPSVFPLILASLRHIHALGGSKSAGLAAVAGIAHTTQK